MKNTKVIICVGSGGVGKTTIAASLGVLAAEAGQKVLVLTIDPANRLASTLGIEKAVGITRVPGQKFKGELYASVIDHKKTFDEFVLRAAKKSESAEKILNNGLYQQLSTNLSGSQEFTAMEKLYSCYESGEYDLIVLDTPPAKHAMDFLNTPQKLSALFSDNVAKWFRDPEGKSSGIFGHLLQTGTKQVLKILERLTGSQFIRELSDFFMHIEKWQTQLKARTMAVHELLTSTRTEFCLVTSFDAAKLKEADDFAHAIRQGGYHLKTLVLNRAFPNWLEVDKKSIAGGGDQKLIDFYLRLKDYYSRREDLFRGFEKRWGRRAAIYRIPDMDQDIADLQDLKKITRFLQEEGEKNK